MWKLIKNLKKEINLNHKTIENIVDYIEENYKAIRYNPKWTLFLNDSEILQNISFVVCNKYILDINIVFDFIRICVRKTEEVELIFASDLTIVEENIKWIFKSIMKKYKLNK